MRVGKTNAKCNQYRLRGVMLPVWIYATPPKSMRLTVVSATRAILTPMLYSRLYDAVYEIEASVTQETDDVRR